MPFEFRQVDVFSPEPLLGNPVAVVHDADALTDEQMAAFARWTNLSETTFLLAPTDPSADYRLRIFTPGGELPFAGHPTLGSAHAWLEAGGAPRGDEIVQECAVGLVTLRRDEGRLSFAAPPLARSGPVDDELLVRIADALGIARGAIVEAAWCDNGPGWVGVRLADAAAVLDLRPDFAALPADVGAVGLHDEGAECAIEVRAFCMPEMGLGEDPVTGSLNAALGQWLAGSVLPDAYVASQGTALQRRGRVHVRRDGDAVWVGGATTTTIRGELTL
ncbi:PhzF family phenazine biosynthesis protein [Microbacterium karelineae]|uniref:PhzF family phenazine biosynthesis protein n=1 Tax=Microbacterium karelineae TaxID=2654283 RepID=UPI0012EA3586|nr:PhzF family phenazine biosynthesis protein [Microbacterium karelineae]